MILTDEMVDNAMSIKGGWNLKQMNSLGMPTWKHGWRKNIVGKDFPEESVKEFLSLKDAHITSKSGYRSKLKEIRFEPVSTDIKYADQYKHPNWQKARLLVLKRDDFKCVNCSARSKTLHAHHLKYLKGKFIWQVPLWYVVTLCEDCHSEEHNRDLRLKN